MSITLYHGSKDIIQQPEYGKGKPYNDYGLGFYCTHEADMAKEWGVQKDRDGYANKYSLDSDGLSLLNLNDEKYSILTWITILLENRQFELSSPLAQEARQYLLNNFKIEYQNYDLIIGYRADDSYFSFANDFINGGISVKQLSSALRLGKLGLQYVLKSKKAFEQIHFEGYEVAPSSIWYAKKVTRDFNARQDYFDSRKNSRERGDLFITQIIDEEIKNEDLRLR